MGYKRAKKLVTLLEASGAARVIEIEQDRLKSQLEKIEAAKPVVPVAVKKAKQVKAQTPVTTAKKSTKKREPKTTTKPDNDDGPIAPVVHHPGTPTVAELAREAKISEEEAEWQLALTPIDENVRAYLGMKLGDIILKFGTLPQFKILLEARSKLEDIRSKQLKSEEVENVSINKEFVTKYIFSALDLCFERLLTDAPKNIVTKLYAMAKADASMADGEKAAHDVVSSQLRAAQEKIVEKLREIE